MIIHEDNIGHFDFLKKLELNIDARRLIPKLSAGFLVYSFIPETRTTHIHSFVVLFHLFRGGFYNVKVRDGLRVISLQTNYANGDN